MKNHLTNRIFSVGLLVATLILTSSTESLCQKRAPAPGLKPLLERLRSSPNDTNKVLLLFDVGNRLRSQLPDARDSALAFFEKRTAIGKNAHSDSSVSQKIKSALPYFEQGITLAKKLQYDSGVIKNMIGVANVWVDLSQLKRKTALSDSIERKQMEHHFNALMTYVKQKKLDRKTASFYCKLAKLIPPQTSGHDGLIRTLYDSAAVYYHKAKDTKMESWSWYMTAHYYVESRQLEQALKLFQKSIDVAKAAGQDPPSAAYAYMGSDLVQKGDYKGGLTLLQNAYHICAKDSTSSNPDAVCDFGDICVYLGIVNHRMNNVPLSLKYNLTAIRVFEPHFQSASSNLIPAVGNAVTDLIILKRPQEALDLLLRIHKAYPSLKSNFNHYVTITKFMSVYAQLGNVSLAQKYCDSLITFSEQTTIFSGRRYAYRQIADFFTNTKQYDKAKKYALLFKSTLKDEKDFIAKSYYMLYKIDSAQGDFKSALSYYRKHKLLNDSLINETRVKELERLNVEFNTKNREQQLALVSKDAEITHRQLYEAGVKTNIIIGGLVVAVIVLMLIFRLYRLKKRAGDLLQHQRDEIASQNFVLEKVIQEKEWLLQEVHHRVKNNLFMISGLLSMQARGLTDDTAKTAIMNSQNRVEAMSMVHQKLSSDNRISLVDLSSYLVDLIDHLKRSYDTRRIQFKVSVESIIVDARTAISLGLIVNEAITNSIKYAFPYGRPGVVSISLRHITGISWKLVIHDDGVGISSGALSKSIGMTLIEGISEELEGELEIDSSPGFTIEIIFPYEEKGILVEM